ncbi:MAG: bifunctional phosphoribosylaminoimidazolecarboxamide formyltransferase/IMP cyclohydrolase, partial [Acidobacteriaceae bacterium]|nr:bifunctional phosphoribosylaminoimidazolecarboxamide formyltransferase/IMP cyclohydrolase [Acidobacteriaceae bacterium]
MAKIERALLSVTDKTGLLPFAKRLHELGVELISTGGTAKLLRENLIPVREVSDITEFPEMLDGRVKTIHPRIAGGILAVRANPEHMRSLVSHRLPQIDMVVVNLYAFEKFADKPGVTRQELIENIDIGGPTLIRAAAKNFQDVAVVVSPDQYGAISRELNEHGGLNAETHWKLAQTAFLHTAAYDRAISTRLARVDAEGNTTHEALPPYLNIGAERAATLRYGENPHQQAALYRMSATGIAAAEQLHGKELSYNNLVDLDAAWQLIQEFESPAAAIIKHTNPCGCAEQSTPFEAYQKALEADPVSAFGGVLAFNRELDGDTAAEVAKLFVEAVAAPSYSNEALTLLTAKKNLRLVRVRPEEKPELVIKSISGGLLAQTADTVTLDAAALRVVTTRHPSDEEMNALRFGWKVAKHV